MIDYEYVNRRFEDLSNTLLIPAFRRMALTYRATCGDVYTAMELYNELRCVECLEEDYKARIDKYRLRLIRLTKRLNEAHSEPDKNAVMFDKKTYDCKLEDSMVTSYHCLAQLLGDHCIDTVPAQTIVRSIDLCDRNGFSIVEFMLVVCLFFSIQGRSV